MVDLKNSYYDILDDLLYTYLSFCRDCRKTETSHLEIISRINDDFESMEHHPLEQLIHYTGMLSLCSNWHSETEYYFLEQIQKLIAKHDVNQLLSLLDEEGYCELKSDLTILNIIH